MYMLDLHPVAAQPLHITPMQPQAVLPEYPDCEVVR